MKLRRLAQIEDRRLSAYERVMGRKIHSFLKQQIKEYVTEGNIKSGIYPFLLEELKPIYMDFFERQYKVLASNNISKRERFFIDTWDQQLSNYIVTDLMNRSMLLDDMTKRWILDIEASYRRSVVEGLIRGGEAGETVQSLTNYLLDAAGGDIGYKRARTIARTEVVEAVNVAKNKASDIWYEETGMEQGKLWIHRGAKKPRDWHIALDTGVAIPKSEDWVVVDNDGGVSHMSRPHDSRGGAKNVINCGCIVIYTRLGYQV